MVLLEFRPSGKGPWLHKPCIPDGPKLPIWRLKFAKRFFSEGANNVIAPKIGFCVNMHPFSASLPLSLCIFIRSHATRIAPVLRFDFRQVNSRFGMKNAPQAEI